MGGSDFAPFLAGVGESPEVENTNFTKNLFVAEASPYYATFFEDTYHINDKLTVTAGLRWDLFGDARSAITGWRTLTPQQQVR